MNGTGTHKTEVEVLTVTRTDTVLLAPQASADSPPNQPASKWRITTGIFLLVLAVYALTSPGRIDIIDGQTRFDVAYNWLAKGRPILRDPWISLYLGVPGRDGFRYASYGAPASVFAMPLVWLGPRVGAPAIEASQFLFSLTGSIFGAGIAAVLFLFYLELGVARRQALRWTMVSSFATLVWPMSTSTFDNAQHTFFVLGAFYFGFVSAKRRSAAYAMVGGLMTGMLVLYQEYFLLIVPTLALSTVRWQSTNSGEDSAVAAQPLLSRAADRLKRTMQDSLDLIRAAWSGPGDPRSSYLRYAIFVASVSVGVILSLAYNDLRFGSWLDDGKFRAITAHAYPLFGNPLAGLLTLLVSPGKSIFLYSPPVLLCLMGMHSFRQRHPQLAVAVMLTTIALVTFLSCISFVGGDWCWGPRYLTVLLPLWALTLPFISLGKSWRQVSVAIVGLGLLVQVMALSVENQRFFFENDLHDYFWAEDAWVYFKRSALFSRAGEMVSLSAGVPATARYFNAIPVPDWCTYTILGPPPTVSRNAWMRNYKIFYFPRPWPLWMAYLPPAIRPIQIEAWLWGLLGLAVLGGCLARGGLEGRHRDA